jgi:tetratricopeptide (TPR) repeat protein
MGHIYKTQKKYAKALAYFQKSLSMNLDVLGDKNSAMASAYDNIALLYREQQKYDSAAYFHQKALIATSVGFESSILAQNPMPSQAIEKSELFKFLERKAQTLAEAKRYPETLNAYAVAAQCASLVMQKAQREQDKLAVAARAHPVHTQAAYLHFLRGKRE